MRRSSGGGAPASWRAAFTPLHRSDVAPHSHLHGGLTLKRHKCRAPGRSGRVGFHADAGADEVAVAEDVVDAADGGPEFVVVQPGRGGGGGARGVAGGGDERSATAGPDSAVGLSGATEVAATGGSPPGRQPATAHVQTQIALGKTLLQMQQKFVTGVAGNGWVASALRMGRSCGR